MVRRGSAPPADDRKGRPYGGLQEVQGAGRCRHRPLRRFDKKVPAWNPPVTALPYQGPLGKEAFGDGDADCHNQRARWFRNDILQEVRWSVAHMGAALQGLCRAGPACPAVGAGKIRFGPM